MDTNFSYFKFGENGVTSSFTLTSVSFSSLTFKAAEMFIFNGKVNGDININTVNILDSTLKDDAGDGKFFDF